MSEPASTRRPLPDDETYAPEIKVLVEKQEVALADILELRVTLQRDEVGGFSMQLANPRELEPDGENGPGEFRHFSGTGKQRASGYRYSDRDGLDLFKQVEIWMGYAGRLKPVFVGVIQTLAPSFPSSGMPTIQITGTDPLSRLRRAKPGAAVSKSWSQRTDREIAEQIARRYQLELSRDSERGGASRPITNQRDKDDLSFLLWLAKRNDFEAVTKLEDGKLVLYFGRPHDRRGPEAITERVLTWGESLISFTPRLAVGHQVSEVTVRGWDSRTKAAIEYTARVADLGAPGSGKSGGELLEAQQGKKTERIVDRVVQTLADAKALAIQYLADTANDFMTGTGEMIGDPDVRPEVNITLEGLGERYDGKYKVTKADHVYGANGYTTSFEVERMREGRQ